MILIIMVLYQLFIMWVRPGVSLILGGSWETGKGGRRVEKIKIQGSA